MTSIEEIEAYDYTAGYPEMLKFELIWEEEQSSEQL
jgi:hypothetical protein